MEYLYSKFFLFYYKKECAPAHEAVQAIAEFEPYGFVFHSFVEIESLSMLGTSTEFQLPHSQILPLRVTKRHTSSLFTLHSSLFTFPAFLLDSKKSAENSILCRNLFAMIFIDSLASYRSTRRSP